MAKTYSADVRPAGNGGNWIKVETEAESLGGAQDIFIAQYNLDPNHDIKNIGEKWNGGSFGGGDSDSNLVIGGGICALAAAWWLLPWIASGAAGYGAYKVAKGRVSSAILAGIIAASGITGFVTGKAIKGEFNTETANAEQVQTVDETN